MPILSQVSGERLYRKTLLINSDGPKRSPFNDKHFEPYDSQQDAIGAAIDAAYATGNIGIDAEVLFRTPTKSSGMNGRTVSTSIHLGGEEGLKYVGTYTGFNIGPR